MDVTCRSCNRTWQNTTIIICYDDEVDNKRYTSVGICTGCVDDLYNLDQGTLVSMLVMSHHVMKEVRDLPMKEKQKLANIHSAKELISFKLPSNYN